MAACEASGVVCSQRDVLINRGAENFWLVGAKCAVNAHLCLVWGLQPGGRLLVMPGGLLAWSKAKISLGLWEDAAGEEPLRKERSAAGWTVISDG